MAVTYHLVGFHVMDGAIYDYTARFDPIIPADGYITQVSGFGGPILYYALLSRRGREE